MRAFFCFFFVFTWVLNAQEKSDIQRFEESFIALQERVELAIKRELDPPADQEWVTAQKNVVEKLEFVRETFFVLDDVPAAEKVRLRAMSLQPVITKLKAINKRIVVEDGVRNWSTSFIDRKIETVQTILTQLRQIRVQFPSQVQEIQGAIFSLEVVESVLADKEFSPRVCRMVEGCLEKVETTKSVVAKHLLEMMMWQEEAKKFQINPTVPPPLPDPEAAKPVINIKPR